MSKLKITFKIIVLASQNAFLNMHLNALLKVLPPVSQYALLNVLRPVSQNVWLKKGAKLIATADMHLTYQLHCRSALLWSRQL